jgi:hypothetical protein
MPLEIRELKIKVTVEESAKKRNVLRDRDIQVLKTEIIRECTEKVMKKINQQKYR